MTPEERKERREARKLAREAQQYAERIEAEKNQKPVRSLTISIEWKKSRMWGANPHANARVVFHDGTHEFAEGFTCSGCGYDKVSTVVGQIFDRFLKYKLYLPLHKTGHERYNGRENAAPYGIEIYEPGQHAITARTQAYRGYGQGVGISCYYAIAEAIGGEFVHVAGEKWFDVFTYTDKEGEKL